jgi:hypothetical protein
MPPSFMLYQKRSPRSWAGHLATDAAIIHPLTLWHRDGFRRKRVMSVVLAMRQALPVYSQTADM